MGQLVIQPWQIWIPPRKIIRPKLRPMLSVIGRALGFMGGAGFPAGTATWNPSDKNASYTLSNGDLTADSGAAVVMCRSTISKSSGKWFWENTVTTEGYFFAGVATSSASLSSFLGNDAHGYGYYHNGNKYNNGSGAAYGASFTNGDVIGVALDMDAGTLTFYKNGSSQGQAYSGLSGSFFPACGNGSGSGASVCVANFGASSFAYSVPSGHNPGVYT